MTTYCSHVVVLSMKKHQISILWFRWKCLPNFHSRNDWLFLLIVCLRWTDVRSSFASYRMKQRNEKKINKGNINFLLLQKRSVVLIRHPEILNVKRKSSVYKIVFPFFSLVFPFHRTYNSGFSSKKVHWPWPRIGSTRIRPLMLYGPFNSNFGPFSLIS